MKPKLFLFLVIAIISLILAGCASVVTCPPYALVAPVQSSPANWAIVDSLTPTLNWTFPKVSYPYPNAGNTCIPEKYHVDLAKGPFFINKVGGNVPGNINTYTPTIDLEPGTEYAWGIQPKSFGESGPYAGSRYFFTGPVCEAADLIAPTLLQPFNGEEINEVAPSLKWDYEGSCRPDSYIIKLDTSPDFTNSALNGGTGSPSTRWGPGEDLESCGTYYWQVIPVVGETQGPPSSVFSFDINIGGGLCGMSLPTSRIMGRVWEDLCTVPDGALPTPLPVGCAVFGKGGVSGNGIAEPGEPGIDNVMIRIGDGSCPSTNRGVTFTGSDGNYMIDNLPAGTYCLSLNVADNKTMLIPGGFTFPANAISSTIASHEVTISEEELVDDQNFGWHYQSGTLFGKIEGKVWDDQCKKTGKVYTGGIDFAGCVSDPADSGKAHANGVFDTWESGIADVTVGISQGDCSSPVIAWAKTDVNGDYYFLVPSDGYSTQTYCMSIDANSTQNEDVLGSGMWTFPPNYLHVPVVQRVGYSSPGVTDIGRSFGWDNLNQPIEIGPVITPIFEYPKFHIDLNANCRVGPDLRWRVMTYLEKGMEFKIVAYDNTRTWVYITPAELLNPEDFPDSPLLRLSGHCWIGFNMGTQTGDLTGIPLLENPTLPTFTPTEVPLNCKQYTSANTCRKPCVWHTVSDRFGFCANK